MKKENLKGKLSRRWVKIVTYSLGWAGIAVAYYIVFSILFDTPIEHQLRETNRELIKQYEILSNKYDTLNLALEALESRDKAIYAQIFESDALSNGDDDHFQRDYDQLLVMTNNELSHIFFEKLNYVVQESTKLTNNFDSLQNRMISLGDILDYIPAIQPIVNSELTKLAASYGRRIHPFYKELVSHQGIDFATPENSRVFATADGIVEKVTKNDDAQGITVLLNHGYNYKTFYAHLNKATVRKGQSVKRGDIIAHTGNTGLSFMPHLHYEVLFKGMRVDPINYFFMELNSAEQNRLNELAQIGMQSLD